LRLAVEDYFPGKNTIMVYGASEDKDIPGMLQELDPVTGTFILVKSFHPRSADLDELYNLVQEFDKPIRLVPDVADALEEAVHIAGENDVILVTGSIFVVAGARMAWYKKRSAP
jgi:dihydrofolate synthase/folylpolyglutamate synthase